MRNQNNKPPIGLWLLGAVLVLGVSCQSLQKDLLVSSTGESGNAEVTALEAAIVLLEGEAFDAPETRVRAEQRGRLAEERQRITELGQRPHDPAAAAQIAAWSGRLYALEGRASAAAGQLEASRELDAGNLPALVLALRLEPDNARRLALVDEALAREAAFAVGRAASAGTGPAVKALQAERGRALYSEKRFQEAVAAFDAAFGGQAGADAEDLYYRAYRDIRERAWDMRSLGTATEQQTVDIVRKDGMSWRDLIELTSTESGLLQFITAGAARPTEELFSRLAERSFIPYTQDIAATDWPAAAPKPDEPVLRAGAAWFLWRLYAENRGDKGLLSRYSARYANRPDPRSPIPDVPLLSPFFDAILGCVETELISLPDGRNFVPDEPVRGAAFLGFLKKVK